MAIVSNRYSKSLDWAHQSTSDPARLVLWVLIWVLVVGNVPAWAADNDSAPDVSQLASDKTPGQLETDLQPSNLTSDSSNSEHADHEPAFPAEHAAQRARERFGGRVLNVRLERGSSGPYYRVKILEHGRVRIIDIDARD